MDELNTLTLKHEELTDRLVQYFLSKILNPKLKLTANTGYYPNSLSYYVVPSGITNYTISDITFWTLIKDFGVMLTYRGDSKVTLHMDFVTKDGNLVSKSSKPFSRTPNNFRKKLIMFILSCHYPECIDLAKELKD